MRKAATAYGSSIPSGVHAVTVEPLPGHSDEEVVASLEELGAYGVTVLAPGFISAEADRDCLLRVEEIAHVHVQRPSHAYRF